LVFYTDAAYWDQLEGGMVHADSETEPHVKLVFHFIIYQTLMKRQVMTGMWT
jgi:hypothetical protein